jgi:hypothetical protein
LADNQSSPILLPEDLMSDYVGDRGRKGRNRSFPPVNGPIWLGGWAVNDILHFFCNVSQNWLFLAGFELLQRQPLLIAMRVLAMDSKESSPSHSIPHHLKS